MKSLLIFIILVDILVKIVNITYFQFLLYIKTQSPYQKKPPSNKNSRAFNTVKYYLITISIPLFHNASTK